MGESNHHRQELEKIVVRGNVARAGRGQLLAFTVVIAGLCVVGLLVYTGSSLAGLSLVIAELVGLGGLFVTRKRHEDRERSQKRRALSG